MDHALQQDAPSVLNPVVQHVSILVLMDHALQQNEKRMVKNN